MLNGGAKHVHLKLPAPTFSDNYSFFDYNVTHRNLQLLWPPEIVWSRHHGNTAPGLFHPFRQSLQPLLSFGVRGCLASAWGSVGGTAGLVIAWL